MQHGSFRPLRRTVAFVDDDARMLRPQTVLLSQVTSRVDLYPHPLDAVEHIPRRPPTAVVIGQRMSHVSGVDVARALRRRLGAACPRLVLLIDDEAALTDEEIALFDEAHERPLSPRTLVGILARAARQPAAGPATGPATKRAAG
jgi:DNA-binding NtrC family response regulator